MVCHWVTVMEDRLEERGRSGQEGIHKNSLFYTDDGMVVLSDPRWIKGGFSTLVCLFYMVVLNNNAVNIVGMVCRPFQAAGTQLEAAYRIRMT